MKNQNILGSSNGRTAPFGGVDGGSNPPLRTGKSTKFSIIVDF
jgi:hypothetical protein